MTKTMVLEGSNEAHVVKVVERAEYLVRGALSEEALSAGFGPAVVGAVTTFLLATSRRG
jgi:hypothetical protein